MANKKKLITQSFPNKTNIGPDGKPFGSPFKPTGSEAPKEEPILPPAPEVFKNEAGRASGVSLPDGRVFLGLSPEDTQRITQDFNDDRAALGQAPLAINPVGTNANRVQAQREFATPLVEEKRAVDKNGFDISQNGVNSTDDIVQKILFQGVNNQSVVINKQRIANFADFARTAISGKKPLRVQQAEGALNDVIQTLSDDVALAKQGLLRPTDARQDLIRAQGAVQALEDSQKGIGKENLRYWSDNGAEVQAMIINAKREIENLQLELNAVYGTTNVRV